MKDRFSFTDLFVNPIEIEKGKTVILDKIVIPKIQRPYAQGRSDGVSMWVSAAQNTYVRYGLSLLWR